MTGDTDRALLLARQHLDAGRFAEAAAVLDFALGGAAAAAPEGLLMRGLAAHRLGDAATALACLDRAVAAAPESELVHYNRAVVLQAAGRTSEAADAYCRAIALKGRRLGLGPDALAARVFDARVASVRGWAEATGAPFRAWPCAPDDSRPLPTHVYAPFRTAPNEDFVVTVDDARVVCGAVRASHFQYVLTSDGALLADRLNFIPRYHLGHGFSFAKIVAEDGRALIDLLDYPDAPPLAGRHVLLGGAPNYYHWLFEFLPRIDLVRRCPDLAIDGWLVNAAPAPWQIETLAALGIPPDALVPLASPSAGRVERLYVPSVRRLGDAAVFLRDSFGRPAANPSRHLFVSRKDAKTARIANEDAVFAALEPLGFVRVTGGGMTVARQAALFAEAAVIVGVHGAGMANIVFAPPSARIIELRGGRTGEFDFFAEIARILGQPHSAIAATGNPPTIDPQAVVARVG